MRKEEFYVGSYVHVFNRGTKRMNIVRNEDDKWRFLKLVRYLNDQNVPRNWEREIGPEHIKNGFSRPEHWPAVDPYVSILSYCLMDNHFHFQFLERKEHGISKFMHRLCTSMSAHFNAKYREVGTLFEGPYQARVVNTDRQLQYLTAYIHIKNPLELYPGGIDKAADEFDTAYKWAEEYPFSSFATHSKGRHSVLLDAAAVNDILLSGAQFKRYARDVLRGKYVPDDWGRIAIDE